MTIRVTLEGEWEKARAILDSLSKEKLQQAAEKAVALEAHYMVGQIVKYMRKGVPPPLSPLTIARRKVAGFGGTKALIRTGDLRNSITVVQEGAEVFVGVLRSSSTSNVADAMEFGRTVVIQMTPKMRRFLFGVLFKATRAKTVSDGLPGTGIIVIKIPPRPFIAPVFEAEAPKAPERMVKWLKRVIPLLGNE